MKPYYYKYLHTFFVVTPMTFFIGVCGVIINESYQEKAWVHTFLISWLTVLPIAYVFALIIIPLANKLTSYAINKKL